MALAHAVALSSLEHLDVAACGLGAADAMALADVLPESRLRSLSLAGNRIAVASTASAFERAVAASSLERLDLAGPAKPRNPLSLGMNSE